MDYFSLMDLKLAENVHSLIRNYSCLDTLEPEKERAPFYYTSVKITCFLMMADYQQPLNKP